MSGQQELPQPELLREGKHDPKRYLKCAQPFPSKDAGNAALTAFMEEVEAAREKHLIANVSIVIKDSCDYGNDVGEFMVRGHFGNSLEEESMLAYAYGQASAGRQERIFKALGGGGIKQLKKRR